MQQSIGEYIRQARRQHNITQTELGGSRFSKSYVSAVERNKIASSFDALRFFAEQLGRPADYFVSLLQQLEVEGSVSRPDLSASQGQGDVRRVEALTLLNVILDSTDTGNLPPHFELPAVLPELVAALPPHKQSRYHFLSGLQAKEKHDLVASMRAFECALAYTPVGQDAAILDELGLCHYLRGAYQTALTYHLRALRTLADEACDDPPGLVFRITSHCGHDHRAMGEYEQARAYYERARQRLNSEHDMKTAGSLYHALGYSTYAAIHQKTALSVQADQRASQEELEQKYQSAIALLVQSRNIYQISSDAMGETDVRLTQASALLDLCVRQRQVSMGKSTDAANVPIASCASTLKDAEEQCRQALVGWQGSANGSSLSPRVDVQIYIALAYLIRIATQRALLGRLAGYVDTAFRERSLAAYLCQEVLNSLAEDGLPWVLIQNVGMLHADDLPYQPASLPKVPELADGHGPLKHAAISQIEAYYAAGEVSEELGRVTPEKDYALSCYQRANSFYQQSLALARSLLSEQAIEPDFVISCYQRCICALEERLLVAPSASAETTRTLLNILENAFYHLRAHSNAAERVAG
jgi:tetratricopeptide (TPR) repeat protein